MISYIMFKISITEKLLKIIIKIVKFTCYIKYSLPYYQRSLHYIHRVCQEKRLSILS